MATDITQTHPPIRLEDLADPTLSVLNREFDFLYSQLAQTQGISGTAFQFKRAELNSTDIPDDDNAFLTLGAYKKLVAGTPEPTTTTGGVALPVQDSVSIVKGSANPTKQMRFSVSSVMAGATRVLTVPDRDLTINQLELLTAAASADLTCTTGAADIVGATVTLDKTGTYYILGIFRVSVSVASGVIQGSLVVGGVTQAGIAVGGIGTATGTDNFNGTVAQVWKYANTGSNVAKLQGLKTVNAGVSLVVHPDTQIFALFVG